MRQVRLAAEEWHARNENETYRWPHERLQPVYEALDNLGIDRKKLNEAERAFIRPEFERLLEELEKSDTKHKRREVIGDRLERLGDGGKGMFI